MEIEWRTIQMFLGDEGISEVSVDIENPSKIRCSCKVFQQNARCKHSKFMKEKLNNRNETVKIAIPDDVSDEDLNLVFSDVDRFRDFVIKYGKVLVL